MPAKDQNLPVNCENFGKSVVKAHIARHRKTCMMGTLYCKKRNCNFAAKNAAELSYHIAKAHGAKVRNTLNKCVVCQKQFPSFYSLQLHRKKAHQASTKIGSSSTNRVCQIMEKVDNDSESLNEELAACQHLLDDMHAEHGRQEVFNFTLSDLDNKKDK